MGRIGLSDSRQLHGRNSDAVTCQKKIEKSGMAVALGLASSMPVSSPKVRKPSVMIMRDAASTNSARV